MDWATRDGVPTDRQSVINEPSPRRGASRRPRSPPDGEINPRATHACSKPPRSVAPASHSFVIRHSLDALRHSVYPAPLWGEGASAAIMLLNEDLLTGGEDADARLLCRGEPAHAGA